MWTFCIRKGREEWDRSKDNRRGNGGNGYDLRDSALSNEKKKLKHQWGADCSAVQN